MTPAPRRSSTLQARLRSAFTERLALKASAVLLSVVLWFVVAAREPTEEVVGVRFAPQLDSGLVLRDPPPGIRALVIGRPSEILKLSTTPLAIRRPLSSDAPDTLVLTLRTSDVEVPEGVEVIVRDVQPRSLMLRFESTVSREVPVRSRVVAHGTGPAVAVSVQLDPESVTVSGPRRDVARLRFIATLADTVAIDTLPHLVDLDTSGLGVLVRPPQVKALVAPRRPRE
ncbi:MAG TPA: hypothetical protein VJ867_10950 [Gemmatimonadaceae bacterium]|nr:hypothetical protein [Gemmatimonadaceae bacterium]